MKNSVYKKIFMIIVSLFLFSCNNEDTMKEMDYVKFDKVTRIELSPNGTELISDGKSELKFIVKCYYTIDGLGEKAMIMDRVPLDKIKINSSDDKSFGINDSYKTTSSSNSMDFTCSIGDKKSNKVTIDLKKNEQKTYKKIVIPIIFHAVYTDDSKDKLVSFTEEYLNKILDRANKVFAGTLYNAPSSGNSGIEFKLEKINKVKITKKQQDGWGNLYQYTLDNLMEDHNKCLNIWVYDGRLPYQFDMDYCVPKYTFGEKSNLPGLELEKITNLNEVNEVKPEDVGFAVSFYKIYQMLSGGAEKERFEKLLGNYYGLLSTSYYIKNNFNEAPMVNNDLDYCSDTYSYIKSSTNIQKITFPIKGDKNLQYYYDSYNIMDDYSSCTTISSQQVKRIRKVMEECAFRQVKE